MSAADPGNEDFRALVGLGLIRVGQAERRAGRWDQAAASFREGIIILEAALTTPNPDGCYNVACYHALLSDLAGRPGSGVSTAEGRAEADRAMRRLRDAVAAGYRNYAHMRVDTDLDPLRRRPTSSSSCWTRPFPPRRSRPEPLRRLRDCRSDRRSGPRGGHDTVQGQPRRRARKRPPLARGVCTVHESPGVGATQGRRRLSSFPLFRSPRSQTRCRPAGARQLRHRARREDPFGTCRPRFGSPAPR